MKFQKQPHLCPARVDLTQDLCDGTERAMETNAFCKPLCEGAGYIMAESNPGVYTIHYRAPWQVPTCHSSASTTSQRLISHPHWNGCGFICIWMRSGPGPGPTGMVKVGAAHKSLPLCCSCRLSILLRLLCHSFWVDLAIEKYYF